MENNISLITLADGSTIAFTPNVITVTNAGGTATTFTTTAPVVAPTDTEVDIVRSDGSVVKVPIPAQ